MLKQLNIFDHPPQPSYHVTTDIYVPEAMEKEKKAEKQGDVIFSIYQQYKMLSPSQAHKIYIQNHSNIPLTSCRRAISNLKKSGFLRKTEIMVTGIYGDKEHVYSII